jgi:hypothetical protein
MTDTKFEAIKARFDAWDIASECNDATKQCHIDRATLIALVESERARADKAEAELERLRKYTQFLIDQADSLTSMIGPNEDDDWSISVRADDLRRLERAADLARAALKETDND